MTEAELKKESKFILINLNSVCLTIFNFSYAGNYMHTQQFQFQLMSPRLCRLKTLQFETLMIFPGRVNDRTF
jgi:hypothetical protein